MSNNEDPRPSCPECGRNLDPKGTVYVVSDDDHVDSSIPEGMSLRIEPTVFAGLYCSSDCIIDAIERGYPQFRTKT